MASAAKKMWPGNNIPTFRNDEAMLKKLDELVKRLLPECEMPFLVSRRSVVTFLIPSRKGDDRLRKAMTMKMLVLSFMCVHMII